MAIVSNDQFKKYLILLVVLVGAQGIEPWTSPV
jgi:hypothetical protein